MSAELDTRRMVQDLERAVADCGVRGLKISVKWAAELLGVVKEPEASCSMPQTDIPTQVLIAKSYFDLGEYRRAADTIARTPESDHHPVAAFLRLYAQYLAGEKVKAQHPAERADALEERRVVNKELPALLKQLDASAEEALEDGEPLHRDGFLQYLRGVVLLALGRKDCARMALAHAVRLYPCNWSAWADLTKTCEDMDHLEQVQSTLHPGCWVLPFFRVQAFLSMQQNGRAIDECHRIRRALPREHRDLVLSLALAQYHQRNFDEASTLFSRLRSLDPNALEGMDVFSNVLFVREERAELSMLAHRAVSLDKYRAESCFVVGNYYSAKGNHEKALAYFRRALTLNPEYLSAWTLMGHEYLELRNTHAAVEAYRRAADLCSRDYRAWYGLGQAYELMHMHMYALHYYRRAALLRPYDPRMWIALGMCFLKLNSSSEAIRAFRRAIAHGDQEAIAALQLAKLYAQRSDRHRAARYFARVLQQHDEAKPAGSPDGPNALRALNFLVQYALDTAAWEAAEQYALRLQQQGGPAGHRASMLLVTIRQQLGSPADGAGSSPSPGVQR